MTSDFIKFSDCLIIITISLLYKLVSFLIMKSCDTKISDENRR